MVKEGNPVETWVHRAAATLVFPLPRWHKSLSERAVADLVAQRRISKISRDLGRGEPPILVSLPIPDENNVFRGVKPPVVEWVGGGPMLLVPGIGPNSSLPGGGRVMTGTRKRFGDFWALVLLLFSRIFLLVIWPSRPRGSLLLYYCRLWHRLASSGPHPSTSPQRPSFPSLTHCP